MDVKFDENAADQLISQINHYCSGILQETCGLKELMNNVPQWNDNQSKAFRNNVEELAKALKTVLSLESEYMRTFYHRVTELRG